MNQRQKPRRTMRQWVGTVILWAGVAMIAVGVGYEAANVPWRALLVELGAVKMREPPDPAPLEGASWATGLKEPQSAAPIEALPESLPGDPKPIGVTAEGFSLLGTIKLPRIDLSENIVEGTDEQQLFHAVGHMPGTAYPGRAGNCVLAGHRNYIPCHPFRNLDKLRIGDAIILADGDNRYTYEVYDVFDVSPDQVWVIEPVKEEESVVTLITCTPLVTMTDRMIVRGRLVGSEPLENSVQNS